MDKNPITKLPEIEEIEKHKSKHKKKETLCSDKRRSFSNCGICGSNDLIRQGVRYCDNCNKEVEYLRVETWYFGDPYPKICECDWKSRHSIGVTKCVTCGAVRTSNCPSCKNECWTSVYGEKYCKRCGYRRKSYELHNNL